MKFIKDNHIIEPNTGSIEFEGRVIVNPTVRKLLEAGYIKYEVPSHEPSELKLKENRMKQIKSEIAKTDYIVLKAYEGCDVSKYGDYTSTRQALRDEYDVLESEVLTLKESVCVV